MARNKRPVGQGWARLGNISFYLEPGAPKVESSVFEWSDGDNEQMVHLAIDAGKTGYWGRYWFVMPIDEARRVASELESAISTAVEGMTAMHGESGREV